MFPSDIRSYTPRSEGKHMKKYKVNGLTILESENNSISGYYGSTVSAAWTLDYENPFIARMTEINPFDHAELKKLIPNKEPSSYHLGYYSDSREAAYVAAMYRENPLKTLQMRFGNRKVDVDFPKELYDIPEYYTLNDAQKDIDIAIKKNKSKKQKPMKLSDALSIARSALNGKTPKNVSQVRKYIEKNLKTFKTSEDIENSVKSMAKFSLDFLGGLVYNPPKLLQAKGFVWLIGIK